MYAWGHFQCLGPDLHSQLSRPLFSRVHSVDEQQVAGEDGPGSPANNVTPFLTYPHLLPTGQVSADVARSLVVVGCTCDIAK